MTDRPFQRKCTRCHRYRFMAGGITFPRFVCKDCKKEIQK